MALGIGKFLIFDRFKFFLNILDFGFNSRNGLRSARIFMRLLPNFSDTKSYGPRKRQSFDFLTVFLKVFDFSQDCPPKYDSLGSIEITGCANLICISGYALFVNTKSYDSQKCQIFDL